MLDGEVLIESGAIISALIRRFGARAPAGFEGVESPTSAFWSTFSEGTLMIALQPTVVTSRVAAGLKGSLKDEGEKRGVDKLKKALFGVAVQNVNAALKYVEEWLGKHENFTGTDKVGSGDVSTAEGQQGQGADTQVMMYFALAVAYGNGKGPYTYGPKTVEWMKRVQARPAFQAAMKRRDAEEKAAKAKL